MLTKLTWLCKTHFNPIAVLGIGACIAIVIILPFVPQSGEETILSKWQGLIGSAFSAAIAIGLFQYQRSIDRHAAIKARTDAATHALKRLREKTNGDYLIEVKKMILEIATKTRDTSQRIQGLTVDTKLQREIDEDVDIWRTEITVTINRITKHCQRNMNRLSAIPRDEFLPIKLKSEIDEIENTMEWWFDSAENYVHILDGFDWPDDEMAKKIGQIACDIQEIENTIFPETESGHQRKLP